METVVYIPVYNRVDWCKSLQLCEGFSYIASDNNSNDGTAAALEAKGVHVIRQPRNLGRVGNWEFCVRHFQQSGAEWMKWLFAGDELSADSAKKLTDAFAAYPDARLIVGDFLWIDKGVSKLVSQFSETRLITPVESMRLGAERGNWFGASTAYSFHREAIAEDFSFGSLPFVSDHQFCLNIAKNFPVLYLAETVGAFHLEYRNYYKAHTDSMYTTLQGVVMHEQAAQFYRELVSDDAAADALQIQTDRFALQYVVSKSYYCGATIADLAEMLSFLPLKCFPSLFWHKSRQTIARLTKRIVK